MTWSTVEATNSYSFPLLLKNQNFLWILCVIPSMSWTRFNSWHGIVDEDTHQAFPVRKSEKPYSFFTYRSFSFQWTLREKTRRKDFHRLMDTALTAQNFVAATSVKWQKELSSFFSQRQEDEKLFSTAWQRQVEQDTAGSRCMKNEGQELRLAFNNNQTYFIRSTAN